MGEKLMEFCPDAHETAASGHPHPCGRQALGTPTRSVGVWREPNLPPRFAEYPCGTNFSFTGGPPVPLAQRVVIMFFDSDNESSYAVSQNRYVEVDKKAHLDTGKSKVSEELCFVDRLKRAACLKLNHHFLTDNHIQSISAINRRAFVLQWQWHLPFKWYVSQCQFSA